MCSPLVTLNRALSGKKEGRKTDKMTSRENEFHFQLKWKIYYPLETVKGGKNKQTK